MNNNIDFLPTSYREAGVQRRYVTLRLGMVCAFVGLIVVAAIYQQHLRLTAESQLAVLLPDHGRAVAAQEHLADLQVRLEAAEQQAELGAFLEHPWPRSRILAAVADPLPPEIELESLKISRERDTTPREEVVSHGPPKPAEESKHKPAPAESDLATLRNEWDNSHVVVTLTGTTRDSAALHRYLDELGRTALFMNVNLSSIERVQTDSTGEMRFTARVIVKPGYGQIVGPSSEQS